MKQETTFRYPIALTIAGSDSSGGAGIQADLKTFSALGVFGASAITSVTAQNTLGVRGIQAISPEILQGQLEAVFEDLRIDAVKIGMLFHAEAVRIVVGIIERFRPEHVILDPVMISTSGSQLIEDEAVEEMIRHLFGRVNLLTPNLDEARFLTGIPIQSESGMEQAAERLLAMGCPSVLMKGGHLGGKEMTDILFSKEMPPLRLTAGTIQTANSHGTGCTLSSAIAAYLALGKTLPEAVTLAKKYITEAIRAGAQVKTGHGHGPLNHFFAPVPLIKIASEE